MGLEMDGMFRACLFGTLAISAAASRGAAGLHILSPLTTTLNYSPFEPDGSIDVRLTYDHRVVDGGTVADALVRLEEVLQTTVLDELLAGPREYWGRVDSPDTPAPAAIPTRSLASANH
jgi:hypothetical protein